MEQPIITIEDGSMGKDGATIQMVSMNKIKIGKNSRLKYSADELHGLMESIKETGLLQPIGLVATESGGYEICYGNRRFLAFSKLGRSKIPAVVHKSHNAYDAEIKNLAENLQRRNISLPEAGRYMAHLKEQGLKGPEIAVRLGVSPSYVSACLNSFEKIPKQFKNKVVADFGGSIGRGAKGRVGRGEVPVVVAHKILAAKKAHSLSEDQTEKLFEIASKDERFEVSQTHTLATAIKSGIKDPMKVIPELKSVTTRFLFDIDEYERLYQKYISEGPFRSFGALLVAIISGKVAERVKVKADNKEKYSK